MSQLGIGRAGESIEAFEKNLKNNLYKIWNHMSSGSCFPPSVKSEPIPKTSGGVRTLGVPTVADRVAQMVVKITLEPILEPIFDDDSYGYRSRKYLNQFAREDPDLFVHRKLKVWSTQPYIKVNGKWVYLYRAVDKEGSTIDFMLSQKRERATVLAFFKKAIGSNRLSEKVNIDKSGSNTAAL